MGLIRKKPSIELYQQYNDSTFEEIPQFLEDWNHTYGNDYTGGHGFLGYLGRTVFFGTFIILFLCFGIGFGVLSDEGLGSSEGWWIVGIYTFIASLIWFATAKNWHKKKCGNEYKNRYKFRPFSDYDDQKTSLSLLYIRAYTSKEEHSMGLMKNEKDSDAQKIGYAIDTLHPDKGTKIRSAMNISSWKEIGEDREHELRMTIRKHW